MIRLGLYIMLFGYGSVVLHLLDMHFVLLSWADDSQPYFGLVLGGVGAVATIVGLVVALRDPTS